jgi:DNA-binding MarR family transcriptional regulator
LGRIAFKKEDVKEIVTKQKQKVKQEKYVDGYNACDGEHSLSDIAKIIGVVPGTLSPILKEWEDVGIIFEVDNLEAEKKRSGGKFYRKMLPI